MKKALLIFLSLVLALVSWSAVCAQDAFYAIPAMRGKYAPVPKTGQTTSYGTNDDGALQKGVAWPTPRFTDNNNGTITDKLTGLIWMKNANAFGQETWVAALGTANGLHSGSFPGLTDGSKAGDWRLPNVRELQSLIDYGRSYPALPGVNPFTNVQPQYWSSTNDYNGANGAWCINFGDGAVNAIPRQTNNYYNSLYVWCVRGGP